MSARYVACMGEKGNVYRFAVGKLEGMGHLEDTGIDGTIILKWFINKYDERGWSGFM
jgi:hypothetical protein